jgi:putative spermidine/putrescine transport system substrate-binding protein
MRDDQYSREYGERLVDEVLMGRMTRRQLLVRASVVGLSVGAVGSLLAACGSPPVKAASGSGATATSAQALGGMSALVAAAKKEGELNVIALPPNWANYGVIINTFKAKYGLTVNSANPQGSSADEISSAKDLKGQSTAPDVFDLGTNVAMTNLPMFAPYKVSTFQDIPANFKDANGLWVNDYGGYQSIGYNAHKVPAITTVRDLLKPVYKNKVAMDGNPALSGGGFYGLMMVNLGVGGSADDVSKGIAFFKQLKAAGNFLPVGASPATEASGQTPVVIDWDYLNVSESVVEKGLDWKTVVPTGAVVGSYYVQAINVDAPHPAAARLWQEFLYSDEGQNLFLKGFVMPVRLASMTKAGTVDAAALAALPKVVGAPVFLTPKQVATDSAYVAAHWAQAVQ